HGLRAAAPEGIDDPLDVLLVDDDVVGAEALGDLFAREVGVVEGDGYGRSADRGHAGVVGPLPGGLVERPQPVVARRRVTRETVHLALEGLDLLTGLLVLDRPFADDVGQVDRLAAQVGPASGRARRREEQAGTQV